MATDWPGPAQPDRRDDGGQPMWVHSCSRVGMRANPPGRSLWPGGWLRRD